MLLADLIAIRGRLGLREFVPIAAQILNGIGHAHGSELMIRDIKPSNVMLCERKGRANFVKILDFGLAKRIHDECQITQDHVMGTVGYVAPEALCGKPADLRVDIYAVGVLFYEMLSGRLPFEGDNNAAIFYKTVHEAAPDLETRLPEAHGIPRPIIDLVHQCLQKRPEDRPRDANALLERLIDAVPPSYFRLPPARETAPLPDAVGNTGMIHLVETGRRAPSSSGRAAGWVALAGALTAVACVLALSLFG
jgi:serine/threonine protein kinase